LHCKNYNSHTSPGILVFECVCVCVKIPTFGKISYRDTSRIISKRILFKYWREGQSVAEVKTGWPLNIDRDSQSCITRWQHATWHLVFSCAKGGPATAASHFFFFSRVMSDLFVLREPMGNERRVVVKVRGRSRF